MVKVLKVLKVLNFSGAGKSNIFTSDDPHPLPARPRGYPGGWHWE